MRREPHTMCGSPLILSAQDDVQVVRYSPKTKTLFCPAKRTSWTCPSAPKRIAVYCDFCSRSSQRPSLSATVFLPFCTVALFPSMESRYSPASSEAFPTFARSEEHTSELQSPDHLVCRLLLEKKKR